MFKSITCWDWMSNHVYISSKSWLNVIKVLPTLMIILSVYLREYLPTLHMQYVGMSNTALLKWTQNKFNVDLATLIFQHYAAQSPPKNYHKVVTSSTQFFITLKSKWNVLNWFPDSERNLGNMIPLICFPFIDLYQLEKSDSHLCN